MNISRRFFIAGAASFGAFGGCRMLRASAGAAEGKPNLVFGVVSDIHFSVYGGPKALENSQTFRHTLEWFRDQGADAVMVVGDMADNGMVEQLQRVADAWYSVFPNDKAPDGRKVEKLFVYGNHDWEGWRYGSHAEKRFPDAAERAKHILASDYAGNWERIFHEPYSPVYRKDIKGYAFIGSHWRGAGCRGRDETGTPGIGDYLAANGGKIDPALPFFYFQHPHPKDTCYGSWAWGRDVGESTKALSAFSNAIAFSGHSHYTLTDERSIWQGAFTSLGTSSLRYTGMPDERCQPFGYENTRGSAKYDPYKVMKRFASGDGRQGMLVRVYPDHVSFARREFVYDTFLGDDWVLPLQSAEPKPFSFAARAAKSPAPAFPAGSAIVVTSAKAKNRGLKATKKGAKDVPSVMKDCLKLEFPPADAVAKARAFEYEVAIEKKDGAREVRRVLPPGFNMSVSDKRAKDKVECMFACDQLPKETFRFVVTPVTSLEKKGTPLASAWQNG